MFAPSLQMKLHPLDFHRMFLGDEPPLYLVEVAIRTTVVFVYTLLLLRVLGKRGVAQLSLFEVTIIIGLGSAVGDPMFQSDVPLVHAMVVIGVIVLLYRMFMALVRTNERFERFVEGEPACLVTDGRISLEAMKKERLSHEELFEILRGSGITQLGEVKRAFLEQSGTLSVFAYPPREVKAGLAFVPPWDIEKPKRFPSDDGEKPTPRGDYACCRCGQCRSLASAGPLGPCERCDGKEWTHALRAPLGDVRTAIGDDDDPGAPL